MQTFEGGGELRVRLAQREPAVAQLLLRDAGQDAQRAGQELDKEAHGRLVEIPPHDGDPGGRAPRESAGFPVEREEDAAARVGDESEGPSLRRAGREGEGIVRHPGAEQGMGREIEVVLRARDRSRAVKGKYPFHRPSPS